MYQASSGFVDALRFGTTLMAAQLTLYSAGQPTTVVVPVSDGSFTVDRNSEFRRQGTLTIEVLPTVPPETATLNGHTFTLLPLAPNAILAPFGNEVGVAVSIVGPGGVAGANGWVPLGIFQIATSTVDDTGSDLVVTLELYDRSWGVAQRQLLTAYTVGEQTSPDLQSEVAALINTVYPGAPWSYNIQPSTQTPPYTVPVGTYNQGQDPWQACLDMAAACNYELYFDVAGNVVGKLIPSPTSSKVVWNFYPGEVSAIGTSQHSLTGTPFTTPVDVSINMTRDGVSNNFFVTASGATNTPAQANAADTNPNSPTFINGPMGNIPSFVYDSNITSSAQALAEAEFDLAASIGASFTISVDTPPNPLFDIDDVCTVTQPRLGLNLQKFVVDSITTSIRYDADTNVTGRIVTA